MKKLYNDIFKAVIMGFVVPALLLGLVVGLSDDPAEAQETTLGPVTAPSTETAPSYSTEAPEPSTAPPTEPDVPEPAPVDPSELEINVVINGKTQVMKLEEYLLGVMLAEVPVSFEKEALKAQAVASRTYTLKCCTNPRVHGGGAVCNDSTCCQGYISPEKYIIAGGKWSNLEKMRKAVEATAGQVMTYNGSLILSTYFACSGGSTENALEVWGLDYPYLQSVSSPGEEDANVYAGTVSFTAVEFAAALGAELTDTPDTWFGKTSYTTGGGVLTMEIGGVSYEGTELRTRLGLRSTIFSVSVSGDAITIQTRGHGHRVGMSQFGADAMAAAGKTYDEILHHYYSDIVIAQYAA